MKHASDASHDDELAPGAGGGGAPGRRPLTERLPVQLASIAGDPAAGAPRSSAWAACTDDPFGMHLLGAGEGRAA